jgi:hypothetical protein
MSITDTLKRSEVLVVIGAASMFMAMFDAYFDDIPVISPTVDIIGSWVPIIGFFLLFVGATNMVLLHSRNVIQRRPRVWWSSSWLLLIIAIGVGSGIIGGLSPSAPELYWMTSVLAAPIGALTKSLTSFYVITATYRAFKARNWQAAAAIITCCLVILRLATFGEAIWPGFIDIGAWLEDVPQVASYRGLLIAAALGSVLLAYRAFIGLERRIYGVVEIKAEEVPVEPTKEEEVEG